MAIEINRREILRIPRNTRVERLVTREARLLRALETRLPTRVPSPASIVTLTTPRGWKALLYRRIPGRGLDWGNLSENRYATLIREMRPILSQLAAFPVSVAKHLGIPSRTAKEWRTEMNGFYRYTRRVVFPLIPPALRPVLNERLIGYLRNKENFRFKPTLLHTDLHSSHVLWSGNKISGIIDWGDAEIGDPAREFAQWAAHFGTADVAKFAANRLGPEDRTFVRRVETYRLFRPIWHLRHAALSGNPVKAREGAVWLRRALTIDPRLGWSD